MTEQPFCILIITASQLSCREAPLLPLQEGIQVRCSTSVWGCRWGLDLAGPMRALCGTLAMSQWGRDFFSPAVADAAMMKTSCCQGPSHKTRYPVKKEPTYRIRAKDGKIRCLNTISLVPGPTVPTPPLLGVERSCVIAALCHQEKLIFFFLFIYHRYTTGWRTGHH